MEPAQRMLSHPARQRPSSPPWHCSVPSRGRDPGLVVCVAVDPERCSVGTGRWARGRRFLYVFVFVLSFWRGMLSLLKRLVNYSVALIFSFCTRQERKVVVREYVCTGGNLISSVSTSAQCRREAVNGENKHSCFASKLSRHHCFVPIGIPCALSFIPSSISMFLLKMLLFYLKSSLPFGIFLK